MSLLADMGDAMMRWWRGRRRWWWWCWCWWCRWYLLHDESRAQASPPPHPCLTYIYIYQEHNGSDLSMSMVMMPMHARSDIGWGCLLDGWMDGWGMMVLTRAPPLEEHADGGGATWHVIGASWVIMNRKEQNTSLPRPSTELRWLLAPGRWPSPSSSRMGSSRMFPLSRKNQDNLISKTKQKHAIFQDN